MGKIKNGYLVIKNILTKEEQLLLENYTSIQHRFNTKNFDGSGQSDNMDTCFYDDPTMEALLLSKVDLMERATNLKLFPTYSSFSQKAQRWFLVPERLSWQETQVFGKISSRKL